ncbi:MAG TPA: serine/threonine-protein kinase, partial [Ktedonobacteraceae bacterium]|nr:serine/threonine-protein kinase [Ktedonobacteraceae bacterium]
LPLHVPTKEPLLKERYHILAPIGQGGFGAVYKVEDTHDGNRLLAMKEINLSAISAQEIIEATFAFNREVAMLSVLANPNLPRIYDHFTDREHWYLLMDFIEGETLEQYLKRTRNGHLPLKEVLDIGIQLCSVLDYLHTREPSIIYRDLKPSNVMRASEGNLYLIDFGIARHFKPGQRRDTIPLGSPGYAAPEQYGKAQTTCRADIYSLGALLYQLFTGINPEENPFRFEMAPLQARSIPHQLRSLVLQMVEMDVNNRPSSMSIIKQELEQIVTSSRPVGTLLSTCHHFRLVLALAWSPDGAYIVSATVNNAIHVWDATSGCHLYSHRDPIKTSTWTSSLAWSPDGEHIACGSDDKLVRVWQVERDDSITLKPEITYRGHSSWVNAVSWSPDGNRIASGSDDKTVHVWQLNCTGDVEIEIYRDHSLWVTTLAWSPNGNYIASGGNDAAIHVWDVSRKETYLIYRSHRFGVNALAWSPDGTRIASCSWDNIIRVWDSVTGKTLFTYRGHASCVNTVAWSPDGTHIASGGRDKTVHVWDAFTGRIKYIYHGHASWVYAVAWSPDGTRIASAGNDGTMQIWQAL